jgi:hypothetical protein
LTPLPLRRTLEVMPAGFNPKELVADFHGDEKFHLSPACCNATEIKIVEGSAK